MGVKASFIYKLWSCVSVFQILFVVTLLLMAMLFGASDKVLFIRDSEFGWIYLFDSCGSIDVFQI